MTRPTRAAARSARLSLRRSPSGSEGSVIVVSDSDSDSDAYSDADPNKASPSPSISAASSEPLSEPEPEHTKKRKRVVKRVVKAEPLVDIEDCARPHGREYHRTAAVVGVQDALLAWFDRVRDERGMPWRKRYDAGASREVKAQRAYEVWVSEVMLQQTQVATVIDYWTRWLVRWPTIADLAAADVEEVNAAWRGLGYYRRARSLLEGAKAVKGNSGYGGRLPSDPDELEKNIPGVGRYTAGAIASIAYGVRTPIVDGNIHRVLTRLLAVHAPQAAPATTRFLWDAAEELVDALPKGLSRGIAGDWNQALMELGATVCRPVNPDCGACPVREACMALKETTTPPPPPTGSSCDLCEPIPPPLSVTSFPMKKTKKASREEHEVVVVTEWRGSAGDAGRRWLFSKRPEKGLLAGLFEPPTFPAPSETTTDTGTRHVLTLLADVSAENVEVEIESARAAGAVVHIFSHINMTYHAQHVVITSATLPEPPARHVWLDEAGVERANVGTGVKKVWAAVYGKWGCFDAKEGAKVKAKAKATAAKASKTSAAKRRKQ